MLMIHSSSNRGKCFSPKCTRFPIRLKPLLTCCWESGNYQRQRRISTLLNVRHNVMRISLEQIETGLTEIGFSPQQQIAACKARSLLLH